MKALIHHKLNLGLIMIFIMTMLNIAKMNVKNTLAILQYAFLGTLFSHTLIIRKQPLT